MELIKEMDRLKSVYLNSKSNQLYKNGCMRTLRDLKKFMREKNG